MKRGLKILLGVVAAVALVLTVGIVLAKVLITPERVRETVLPLAEKTLHRKVDFQRIDVGLFSGISCQELSIGSLENEAEFVQADALVLRYRFWPLLLGRVVIDEVTVRAPAVRIVRYPDGAFNFSDLLTPKAPPAPTSDTPSQVEESSSIDLLVSRVSIVGGQLEFLDQAVSPGQSVSTHLNELNLSAESLSLKRPFPLALDFRLNGAPLSWAGEVNAAQKSFDGQVRIESLDVAELSPYYAQALPGRLQSLSVSADLTVRGNDQQVVSRGGIDLQRIGLTLDALPKQSIRDGRLTIDLDLSVGLEKKILEARVLSLAYNQLTLEASGRVDNYLGDPSLDLQVRVPEIAVADVVRSLPEGFTGGVDGMEMRGSVKGKLHLLGSTSNLTELLADGELLLKGVGAKVAHLEPLMTGTLKLERGELSGMGLTLDAGGSHARFDVRAKRLFEHTPYLSADVTVDRVDLGALVPPVSAAPQRSHPTGQGADQKPGSVEPATVEIGPFDLPLEADGKVRIASLLYNGLTVNDLSLDWRLERNVFRVKQFSGLVASGSVTSQAAIDLGRKGLTYEANLQAKGIDSSTVVSALAPRASGSVFGLLDLSMNAKGSGTETGAVKRNLIGAGNFSIRNGELTGAGIMQELALFLDVDDLRVFRFTLGQGTVSIREGSALLDASFTGSKARLYPEGRLGLDSSLDLAVKAYLSPENTRKLAGKGTLKEVIADEQGWGLVPLKVGGTWSRPKVSLDRRAVAEQVKTGAERKLREKLKEKVLEELAPAPEDEEGEDPTKQLLRDTLKGLFGN